ncbi:MAG: insulinase family protein [Bacteroidales bacterium]|nr:insulinase family protein [Bacteroidales bacterium]MDD2322766.1 pitrilysin family protein [Bacteroidales bacterium]MDD3960259.1 pitrilysin family protein [Bacteroidales bacterium]HPE86402.1 pitrilysin family protein [Bacteroidales bacterium]
MNYLNKIHSMYNTFTLPSGMRIIHKETRSTVAHCGVMIDAGARDEEKQDHGLAHFIEHVIFKGTEKRKAFHILSRIDNVGGDLNAYTTKEETCIYASFLTGYYERAIELFSDLLFHSVFPEKEIEKEKDVVYDEITSYLDTPWEQIADDFEDQLFAGHNLGRNILGTRECLSKISRNSILNFIKKYYYPKNMVLCSVGPISMKKLIYYAEKYFDKGPQPFEKPIRIPVNSYQPKNISLERNSFQTHVVVGNRAFPWSDERRTTLALLTNYLGGPAMNTRLNMAIREKHGITYNIEAQYTPYSDTGVFFVYMGMDPSNAEKALQLLHKEFEKIRSVVSGTRQLQNAKKQFKGQLALAQESNLAEMLSMGKSILVKNQVDSLEEVHRRIDAVSDRELLETANIILHPQQLSMLLFKGNENE